ncbi:MAG TPA: hypothetical protein VIH31_00440 [Candidatus Paceibacterota bacterium]
MRQNITYKILDFLEDFTGGMADFVEVFLSSRYGASMGEFEYKHGLMAEERRLAGIERDEIRKFKKLVSKLKSDGLIETRKGDSLALSRKGQEKLEKFKNNIDKNSYQKEASNELIIISYDIPEKMSRERRILRELLHILGFNMVHKSVWIGKVKLPELFLHDLKRMKIDDYVEILKVTKTGSLKSV